MSRSFDAGIKGLTTELFAAARAAAQPAPASARPEWTLRTDGAGVGADVAALTRPVTHYQGYGEALALRH